MTGQATAIAAELPFPPKVEDFYLPPLINGAGPWLTKFTALVWIAVAVIIVFFWVTYRNPKLVPTKKQWIAESAYGFVRENVAVTMLGKEGVRFAPYLASLFAFILLTNLMGVIPFIQVSPNSHIAFPAFMAVISYILFNYVGIRRFGFVKYFKKTLVPPAPIFVMPLLIPIEFFSTLVFRPLTLALRLFANMFAGHISLLVFSLGGFAMLNADALFFPVSILSWLMAVVITFLEAFIGILQAYVFAMLTASYIQGAVAEDH